MAELDRVRPRVLVALGATAAAALFGPAVRLVRDRGRPVASDLAPLCLVTYHPSAALRAITSESRRAIRATLAEDFRRAAAGIEASLETSPTL